MSEQSRILVIADEEDLSRNIVTSLRNDGYSVQGASSAAEAIRILWMGGMQHLVIADLKVASADDFELVQWLRLYFPRTYVLLLAAPDTTALRTQALERGVVSIVEKPVNLHLLKLEVQRLLAQTGFSASLDSFDLLDVIQIVTMSRKNIALVVNTGQEERGLLRFQNGELVWAEYGALHGEEAFFALAAYKNGTVSHQPWDGEIAPNVTQPLSRLILQALQYRSKYAEAVQASGELQALGPASSGPLSEALEDTPFVFGGQPTASGSVEQPAAVTADPEREWWMATGYLPSLGGRTERGQATGSGPLPSTGQLPAASAGSGGAGGGSAGLGDGSGLIITPTQVRRTSAAEHVELPSWLTEQPAPGEGRQAAAQAPTGPFPVIPGQRAVAGNGRPTPAGHAEQPLHRPLSTDTGTHLRRMGASEWSAAQAAPPSSGPLQSLISAQRTGGPLASAPARKEAVLPPETEGLTGPRRAISPGEQTDNLPRPVQAPSERSGPLPRISRRNISAIVAALQTLGYAIPGFVATAVLNMEGQPIAQVSVDDLDLSAVGSHLKALLQGALRSLEVGNWGTYEDLVVTSADHRLLLRLIEGGGTAFHILITSREADLAESMEVMANVEGAIAAAL